MISKQLPCLVCFIFLAFVDVFLIGINFFVLPEKTAAQINSSYPYDTCRRLHMTYTESPTCPGEVSKISNYHFTVTVSSADGSQHTFAYKTYNNFCTAGMGKPCVGNTIAGSGTGLVNGTSSKTISYSRS